MSRPFVAMRLDFRHLVSERGRGEYLREGVREMFVKLHQLFSIEPSLEKGYVVEKRVEGFDISLKMTVFDTVFDAENIIRSSGFFQLENYFVLEKSTVQEYIEKMNAGHSDKVEEEPVRLN